MIKDFKLKKYYQLVSNGFNLNKDSINRLVSLGIKDYQITLDGIKDIHNLRRSPKFDSFSKIVNNIIYLAESGATIFLLNVFDSSNLESPIELINYFDELSKNHSSVKKNIKFNFCPTITKQVKTVKCNNYVEGHELDLTNTSVLALAYAKKKGFKFTNLLDIGLCSRQYKHFAMIDPELNLFKCYSSFGNMKYSFGNILNNSYESFIENSNDFSLTNGITELCKKCSYLPLCRGGCQFQASERHNGEYGHMYCEKYIFKKQIELFMKNELV